MHNAPMRENRRWFELQMLQCLWLKPDPFATKAATIAAAFMGAGSMLLVVVLLPMLERDF